jgi:hypothetical protein
LLALSLSSLSFASSPSQDSLPSPPTSSPPIKAQPGDNTVVPDITVGQLRLSLWYKAAYEEDQNYIGKLYPFALAQEKTIGDLSATNLELKNTVSIWKGIGIGAGAGLVVVVTLEVLHLLTGKI